MPHTVLTYGIGIRHFSRSRYSQRKSLARSSICNIPLSRFILHYPYGNPIYKHAGFPIQGPLKTHHIFGNTHSPHLLHIDFYFIAGADSFLVTTDPSHIFRTGQGEKPEKKNEKNLQTILFHFIKWLVHLYAQTISTLTATPLVVVYEREKFSAVLTFSPFFFSLFLLRQGNLIFVFSIKCE